MVLTWGENNAEAVEEAAQIISEETKGAPAVLVGDFNLLPCGWNPDDKGQDSFDALRKIGLTSATSTTAHEFINPYNKKPFCLGSINTTVPLPPPPAIGTSWLGGQLDYIWYTKDSLALVNKSVPSVTGFTCSDHLPLVADFKLLGVNDDRKLRQMEPQELKETEEEMKNKMAKEGANEYAKETAQKDEKIMMRMSVEEILV